MLGKLSLPRKILIFLFMCMIGGGLGAAGFAVTQTERYAVYVDGNVVVVNGMFETVSQVLTAGGITLQSGDIVLPDLSAAVAPDAAIQVQRAKTVTVRTDEGSQTYFTHQPTLGGFLREAQLVIGRTDRVIADGKLVGFGQVIGAAVPQRLEIGRFHTITIVDGDNRKQLVTSAQTVGDAINDAGITLWAADGIQPSLGDWISDNLEIVITRSEPYTILVDGKQLQTRSHQNRPLAILNEAGVGLVGADFVRPAAETVLQAGDTIEVIRVTESYINEDTPIPFESLWQPTDRLEIDQKGLVVAGKEGILRRQTRVVFHNGVEVAREPAGEWVAQEPINEILGYGTRIEVRTVDGPEGSFEYWRKVRMRVTSYTAASSGKAPSHPAYGVTASGLQMRNGIVAVDKTVIPFRTDVYVPGYGRGHAADTGGGIKGRWIDLGYEVKDYVSWRGYVDVYYLTPVPEPERINYLIPTWLP